MYSLIQLFV